METLEQKTKRVAGEIDKIIRDNDLIGIIAIGGHEPRYVPDSGMGFDIRVSHRFIFESSNSNIKVTDGGKGLKIINESSDSHIGTCHFFSKAMSHIGPRYNQLLDMVELEDERIKSSKN